MGCCDDEVFKRLDKRINELYNRVTECCSLALIEPPNISGNVYGRVYGDWLNITNMFFSGDYNDLTNIPATVGISCDDLPNCPTIIGIIESIPTDVSDLTDTTNLLFDGDYDSLTNKPTIGDGTLTVSKNGTVIDTFDANQVGDTTVDIEVPEKLSEIEVDYEDYTLDFTEAQNMILRADYDGMSITTITDVWNSPTVTILAGGLVYVLGTPLTLGTELDFTVDIASVIRIKTVR